MALQTYTVQYATVAAPSTYTDISNVVAFAFTKGRHHQLDQYSADTGRVTVRYPTGYVSPLTGIVPGSSIRIKHNQSNQFIFAGYVNSVNVTYGIPYGGGVGNADYLNFTVESAFAKFGRIAGNNQAITGGTISAACGDVSFYSGVTVTATTTAMPSSLSATTVSGTYGDWIAQACRTINGRIADGLALSILGPSDITASGVAFSDNANNATNQVYDQIEFSGIGDNYYTQVVVIPTAVATSTVQSGSAPYRTLTLNTFNATTTQATDYANYLLNTYNTTAVQISSISCMAEAQNNFELNDLGVPTSDPVGQQIAINFRGSTTYGVIEGWECTATPAGSRYTYYLSGASLNAYLILDNTTFGRLDFNKLGY